MVSKSIPGQVGNESMILMKILTVMSKNYVRITNLLQLFKIFFYFNGGIRKKSVAEIFQDDLFGCRIFQKQICAFLRFLFPDFAAAKNNPHHLHRARFTQA